MNQETIKLILGHDLGDELHDEWKKSVDASKDKSIIDLDFEDLSNELQKENLQAGIVAINLVYDAIISGKEISKEEIEKLSSKVHDAWLERHPKSNNIQSQKYLDLPEEEKAKDRNHILKAISKVNDYKDGKVDLEEQSRKYNIK